MAEATIAGLSGAYGNIGYMGPGLALATLGPAANVPVALIFCFDTLVLFALVPFLMTLASPRREGIAATAFEVAKRIVLHPSSSRRRWASRRPRSTSSRRSRSTG